jgi:transcriptional regulator with XRE-family HTH domain
MKIRSISTKGVGRRIRMLRQSKGWSEAQLAKRVSYILGRPFQQYLVSRVEIEFRLGLKEDELLALAQALEVSHLDLVDLSRPISIEV